MDGEDLGGVQPRDSKPRGTENKGIQINHRRSGSTPLIGSVDVAVSSRVQATPRKTADEEHGDGLPDGAPVECPSATNTINGVHADKGRKHVEDVVEASDPLGFFRSEPSNVKDC